MTKQPSETAMNLWKNLRFQKKKSQTSLEWREKEIDLIQSALTAYGNAKLEEVAQLLSAAKVGQTFNQYNFADAIRALKEPTA